MGDEKFQSANRVVLNRESGFGMASEGPWHSDCHARRFDRDELSRGVKQRFAAPAVAWILGYLVTVQLLTMRLPNTQ